MSDVIFSSATQRVVWNSQGGGNVVGLMFCFECYRLCHVELMIPSPERCMDSFDVWELRRLNKSPPAVEISNLDTLSEPASHHVGFVHYLPRQY